MEEYQKCYIKNRPLRLILPSEYVRRGFGAGEFYLGDMYRAFGEMLCEELLGRAVFAVHDRYKVSKVYDLGNFWPNICGEIDFPELSGKRVVYVHRRPLRFVGVESCVIYDYDYDFCRSLEGITGILEAFLWYDFGCKLYWRDGNAIKIV